MPNTLSPCSISLTAGVTVSILVDYQESATVDNRSIVSVAASDLCSGVGTALELVHDNAIEALDQLVHHSEGDMAKQLVAARDHHSYERVRPILNHSPRPHMMLYMQMKSTLFSKDLGSTAVESNCTMAVIKPHAVKEALSGHIITAISDLGFQIGIPIYLIIFYHHHQRRHHCPHPHCRHHHHREPERVVAAELFYLDRPAAEEFFDVYKGVIPQYCVCPILHRH